MNEDAEPDDRPELGPPGDDEDDAEAGVELAVLTVDDIKLVVVAIPLEVELPELTPAEQSVVQLVLEGCSNLEIAKRRGSSVKTVANQLRRIYEKLGIYSRFELAARLGR